ncbi:MAG TPA: hypothetical protein VF411_04865, partial [Bacteroidia bacterium]
RTDIKLTRFSKLDTLFTDVATDTFYVYSDLSIDGHKFAFSGRPLDSTQVSFLPFDIKGNYNWNKDYSACYKFPIDKSHIALITRIPGEYVSSKITLLVFDIDKDSIIKSLNLADTWGDAGESFVYNSCIFKDKEKNISILFYAWSSYDHRAGDNPKDTLIEYSKNYLLLNLSKNFGDTISRDSATIVTKYPDMLKKLASY